MRIPLFLLGFLVAAAYWPHTVGAGLSARWACMAVGAALCLALTRERADVLGGWGLVVLSSIAVTLAWAPDGYAATGMFIHVLILATVFSLGVVTKDLTSAWIGYAVGIIPSAIIALGQRFDGVDYFDQVSTFPSGLFVNANLMGEASAVALIAMMVQRRWLLCLAPAVCLWLSHNRGAYAAWWIALAFLLSYTNRRWAIGIIAGVAGLAIAWLVTANDPRLEYWSIALSEFVPLGNGLESFATAHAFMEHVHNEPLQLVYELGVFSIPLLVLALYALGGLYGTELAVFSLVAADCFIAFPLHMPATAFVAALAAGALVAGRVRVRSSLLYGRDPYGFSAQSAGSFGGRVPGVDGRSRGDVPVFAPYPVHPGRTARRDAQGAQLALKRWFTQDDAGVQDERVIFYTVEKIGPKRALTPEGFLLCSEVPIARTGEMLYGPGETPISVGPGGVARVQREEVEVFRPEFIASFMGKPVVDDHPPRDVNPNSWRQYARGVVINPRRGTGDLDQFLIADLLICDAQAILDVNDGKVQVSCGYEAEYEETGPGEGRQTNMIGNHVALVDAARCGSRCSIGDRAKHPVIASTGDCHMSNKVKDRKTLVQRIAARLGVKTNDEEKLGAIEEELGGVDDPDEPGGDTHVHVHGGERAMTDEALEERFGNLESGHQEIKDSLEALHAKLGASGPAGEDVTDADEEEALEAAAKKKAEDEEIEGNLKEEAPKGATGDAIRKAIKAHDSAFLQDSFQSTLAEAEILVPGIRVPTFDRASNPKDTFDAICNLRRTALDLAYATPTGRAVIEDLTKDRDFLKMSCADVRTAFKGAAKIQKAINARAGDRSEMLDPHKKPVGQVKTLADLNVAMAKHYGTK